MLFLSSHWNLETVYILNISRYIPLLCSPFSPSTFDCLPNSHSPSAKLAEPTPPSLTKGNLCGLSHLWGPYPIASHGFRSGQVFWLLGYDGKFAERPSRKISSRSRREP